MAEEVESVRGLAKKLTSDPVEGNGCGGLVVEVNLVGEREVGVEGLHPRVVQGQILRPAREADLGKTAALGCLQEGGETARQRRIGLEREEPISR